MNSRRYFLKTSALVAAAPGFSMAAKQGPVTGAPVTGMIGVTTGSFMSHITYGQEAGKISMLDLPKVMRNDLDMRVIDFMSRTLESFEPAYLEKLRTAVEENKCIATNLKCNQRGVDIASPNDETRKEALQTYRDSIDAAKLLGCRWIRPISGGGKNPNRDRLVESYRELIDYGSEHGVGIIIENVGWIANDPDAIPELIGRVGDDLLAGPDTGNWKDDPTRYAGLTNAYPFAVTSDFKAFQLEPDGSHSKYNLEKCFRTGWDAGFRGPWVIEHFHTDLDGLLAGFREVKNRMQRWIETA